MSQKIDLQILDHRIGSEFNFPEYKTDGSTNAIYALVLTTMTIEPGE